MWKVNLSVPTSYNSENLSNHEQNDPPTTGVNGTDAELWAHEWSKHGTCMSTLRRECYPFYNIGEEVVDYFTTTIQLSKSLPTGSLMESCGIVPSDDTTYALAAIEKCLAGAGGEGRPFVGCDKEGSLKEVWYYHFWEGSVKDGRGVRTNSTSTSTCPKTGIRYLPKSN